jgi:outer membrane protease
MGRCGGLLTLGLLAAVTLPAAAEGFAPRFEAGTTFVWGSATELVLRDGTYNNPVSRLVWPVVPSLGLEFSVTLPWTAWTATTLAAEGAFPLALGTMVDEDWNTQTDSGYLVYGNSNQTAVQTSHWVVRAEQSFPWQEWTFSAGLLYRLTSWDGWNGSGTYQYSSYSQSWDFQGLIISYRQEWFIPYLGAAWTWKGQGWTAVPSVRFSPYTWCFDSDSHYYPTYGSEVSATHVFLDSTSGGVYAQGAIEVSFPAGPWSWGLRGAWEIAWGSVGSTVNTLSYQNGPGVSQSYSTASQSAGAWFQELSMSVFIRN